MENQDVHDLLDQHLEHMMLRMVIRRLLATWLINSLAIQVGRHVLRDQHHTLHRIQNHLLGQPSKARQEAAQHTAGFHVTGPRCSVFPPVGDHDQQVVDELLGGFAAFYVAAVKVQKLEKFDFDLITDLFIMKHQLFK